MVKSSSGEGRSEGSRLGPNKDAWMIPTQRGTRFVGDVCAEAEVTKVRLGQWVAKGDDYGNGDKELSDGSY